MLFISNNKKIDAVIKKLQPSLKLKINVERDFDGGLNDVFEKRPDVVFIQNQIAGVTGESVARHIQLLLGGAAPKFIFIHDGDAKAKPKKGLYEYLIDLSQSEETVAANILEKLNLLLGLQWQNIFVTSLFQGVDYEAFTPVPEPPREPVSSFSFDVVPGMEAVVPVPSPAVSPLSLKSEIAPDESFVVIRETDGQRSELFYEECRGGAQGTTTAIGNNSGAEGFSASSEAAIPAINRDLSAAAPEASTPAVTGSVAAETEISWPDAVKSGGGAKIKPYPVENHSPPFKSALADQIPRFTAAASSVIAAELPTNSFAASEGMTEEVPSVMAQEKLQWVFEGEPSLKKSTWKWYQVVEILLVLCLLLGGWYLIKQKPHPAEPVADEVNLLKSAAVPPITQESEPAGQKPLTVALPSFIPSSGLDPAFAAQNPGWERYLGDGSEFRLFRENGRLKAVQVKANKGRVISDSLLKSMLVELTGANEYRVKSREKKLGFLVSHATVNGKAEMLMYTKKSALHAVVVSLD